MNDLFTEDHLGVGTKGLVYVGDDVLVYRRDNNTDKYPLCLDVPGGGKEAHETPFETFRRAVKEEFNLDLAEENIVYSRRYASILEEGKFGWYAVAKLPAGVKDQIVLGDEGTEFLLMPLATFLRQKDAWPVYQQRAADYARYLATTQ